MTNTVCMEAALARVGKTKGECAEALGISCRSLHNKVANITEFKASEIEKLIELLELNDEKFRMIFLLKIVIYNHKEVIDIFQHNFLTKIDGIRHLPPKPAKYC